MFKVSVVLSVHNQEKFLPESIESILEQSFGNFEFIIVDDASTDSSLKIIKQNGKKDKRIKIIVNKKRLGLTKSLNKAIKEAKGDYIARIDADDISLKDRLAVQVKSLDSNPSIAFLGSDAILIDEDNKKLKIKKTPRSYQKIYRIVMSENPFIHPSLVFRRSILEKVGFYNEEFIYAQDYELILRILSRYPAINIGRPLVLYRVGDKKSISIEKLKQQEWFAIKARLKALQKFGYPFWMAIYLIRPLLSFLLPIPIKFFLYQKFFWNIED